MKNIIVEKEGQKFKWTVEGLNEKPCVADIENNHRTALTDYVATMFSERYGCVATVQEFREMSHNQFQEFLQANASRLWTDVHYTMEDYNKDADSVVILDYDLDRFNLSEDFKRVVNRFFDTDSVNSLGHSLFRGHLFNDNYIGPIAKNLECSSVCLEAYRGFYKSDENKCIFSYCEGDISLVLCEDEREYHKELNSYYKFYEIEPEEFCVQVFFDDVHMDNIYVPEDKVEATISFLVQHGYDAYNGDVKEDWERDGGRPNPDLSFKVVNSFEKGLDEKLADAQERAGDLKDAPAGKDSYELE